MQKAIFAAGCFWGVEQKFGKINGVISTEVGYSGGQTKSPTYEEVCSGTTGHAEVVKIEFNQQIVSYEELLKLFFNMHNPTTLNRQGFDTGSQYRSAIFYFNEEQKQLAEKAREKLDTSGIFKKPIVTEITSDSEFYVAEKYHQKYLEKHN